jgi:hypothetical protein
MKPQIEPQHALSPKELDAIEVHLYEHNSQATGRHDGQGLGFVIHDDLGRMIGVAAGYTWAGISELRQMWVDQRYRGCGYARGMPLSRKHAIGVSVGFGCRAMTSKRQKCMKKQGSSVWPSLRIDPKAMSMWFSARYLQIEMNDPHVRCGSWSCQNGLRDVGSGITGES